MMKRFVMLVVLVFVMAGFAGAVDNAKKVVKDVKQTGADIKAVGKDVVEKGKEAVAGAANATTKTAEAVAEGTEKAGKSAWDNIKEFGRRVKNLFKK
jgi:hypothetical protein